MNSPKWLAWAQRLQAIAQTGLTYCKDPFEIERLHAVEQIASEIMAAGATDRDIAAIRGMFNQQTGYATPKVDLRAAVIHEGKILMVRELEDGGWSLPGGWADIGSSPAENIVREVKEESGYDAEVIKLVAFHDRGRHGHPPYPFYCYKIFFLCRLTGGEAAFSNETNSVGFFAENELPPLSLTRVMPAQIHLMFEHYRKPALPSLFD